MNFMDISDAAVHRLKRRAERVMEINYMLHLCKSTQFVNLGQYIHARYLSNLFSKLKLKSL